MIKGDEINQDWLILVNIPIIVNTLQSLLPVDISSVDVDSDVETLPEDTPKACQG